VVNVKNSLNIDANDFAGNSVLRSITRKQFQYILFGMDKQAL
jgi:hypothetical protein